MTANAEDLAKRTPPGQVLTTKWPVLTYGLTPKFNPKTWTFRCFGLVEKEVSWTWEEFLALPRSEVFCDIHCVTRWSRLDNSFEGVPIREIMALQRVLAGYAKHPNVAAYILIGLGCEVNQAAVMATRLPRIRRISTSDFLSRSSPSNRISPLTMRAAGGSRRRSDSASVVFPEPDSPTMPSVSPESSVNDTSLTARTTRVPRALTKCVASSLTWRRGPGLTGGCSDEGANEAGGP